MMLEVDDIKEVRKTPGTGEQWETEPADVSVFRQVYCGTRSSYILMYPRTHIQLQRCHIQFVVYDLTYLFNLEHPLSFLRNLISDVRNR